VRSNGVGRLGRVALGGLGRFAVGHETVERLAVARLALPALEIGVGVGLLLDCAQRLAAALVEDGIASRTARPFAVRTGAIGEFAPMIAVTAVAGAAVVLPGFPGPEAECGANASMKTNLIPWLSSPAGF